MSMVSSRLAKLMSTAAAATLGMAAAYTASAQTILRYTTGAPLKTPWVMQAERLSSDVKELSKDGVKIDIFTAAQLGNEQDTIQQVARGRIDMGGFSTTGGALIVPELSLLGMPFYFTNPAEQDCVIDKSLTDSVRSAFAAKGLRFLTWTAVGEAFLIGKKLYTSPAEVKGLKVAAAHTKMSNTMWVGLGANPNPLGITEIAGAFQTGLVDLQFQVVTFYVASGLNKVAPAMTRMTPFETPGLTLINQAAYDKLTLDQRKAIDDAAARHSGEKMRTEVRGFEKVLIDMHVKGGGQFQELTTQQRDVWRKAMEPTWKAIVSEHGESGAAFFALMEKGRATCAK
jgi:TRAP-type transport system periplasmic protein